MATELSTDLIWSLRACAQTADVQRALYPTFVIVADELALDFDEAYLVYKSRSQTSFADLESLDALLDSKSGISEFWTDNALDQSKFWAEIRERAMQALIDRELPTSAPASGLEWYVKGP